jgi:hypothetical protein
LRDFPDDLHRKTKAEAALRGITMKELIIRALKAYLILEDEGTPKN